MDMASGRVVDSVLALMLGETITVLARRSVAARSTARTSGFPAS
jgi:hypothetical protein